jgi:hypothetical protein
MTQPRVSIGGRAPRPGQIGAVDPDVLAQVLDDGAARVVGINETTRTAVAEIVAQGVDQGMGASELAAAIEAWSGWDEYRAEMIARTETATAYNTAALASYRDSGMEYVQVLDGDGDDICAPWHDVVVSIGDAPDPLGHPNCTRDILPYLGSPDAVEESPE